MSYDNPKRPNDCGWLFLKCTTCGEEVKLAKNKGSYWTTDYDDEWLAHFLLMHGGCPLSSIVIEWKEM